MNVPRIVQRLVIAGGAVAIGVVAAPVGKKVLRPAVIQLMVGAMVLADHVRYSIASAREGCEDMMAEAKYLSSSPYEQDDHPCGEDNTPTQSCTEIAGEVRRSVQRQ